MCMPDWLLPESWPSSRRPTRHPIFRATTGDWATLSPAMLATVWNRISSFPRELTLSEVSGALGDLGTFLPLLVGLVQAVGLDLGATLVATGLYNVVTGLQFGIPMPVQPMKTISAVALSEEPLTVPEIVVAGLGVSVVVLILGATGLMDAFNRFVPLSLVRGIQLGVGMKLAIRGVRMALYIDKQGTEWRDWAGTGTDGLILGIVGIVFILVTTMPTDSSIRLESEECKPAGLPISTDSESSQSEGLQLVKQDVSVSETPVGETGKGSPCEGKQQEKVQSTNSGVPCCSQSGGHRRAPGALIMVVLGIVLTFAFHPSVAKDLSLGPSGFSIIVPTWKEVKTGLLRGGLPQLPLTTLNSVVAVCKLSSDLFPDNPASPNSVAFSVGLMNVVGTWFGVMPCCHGAGGLAAQTRFGARTGAAPVFLGLVKIVLGLVFGSSLFSLLKTFPEPLLGAMLLFSGVELAGCCKSEKGARGVGLMLITASSVFATSNTAIGFGVGAASVVVVKGYDLVSNSLRKRRRIV